MALTTLNTGSISFKKLSGKVHTQQNFAVTEEGISTNVQSSFSTVFAQPIVKLPVTSSGLTALYATNGIVERVKFQIDLIPDTQIAVGKSQGYRLKLPSDYNTFGELYPEFSAGTYLYTALGKLQIVPSLYGTLKPDGSTEYDPILYQTNGSTVIAKFDPINWYFDPYSGILFVQDPPAGYDSSAARPGYLEAFLYVGDYLDDIIFHIASGSTGTTGLNIGGGTGVFKDTINVSGTSVLRFKSFVGRDGIVVSADTDNVFVGFSGATSASESSQVVSKSFMQLGHGFGVSDVVEYSGGTFIKALALDGRDSEIIGIVNRVIDVDNFSVVVTGYISGLTGTSGSSTYYVSSTVAGGITLNEPTSDGSISKPILFTLTPNDGIVLSYRGFVNVTGVTATTENNVTNAENGLTQIGNTVVLGGTLTGDTTIVLNDKQLSLEYVDTSSITGYFRKYSDTGFIIGVSSPADGGTSTFFGTGRTSMSAYSADFVSHTAVYNLFNNSSELIVNDGVIQHQSKITTNASEINSSVFNNSGTTEMSFIMNINSGTTIFKNSETSKGIEYFADYSANYTPRTLVDAGYVMAALSGSSSNANNGLTKSPNGTIHLGGDLTGNTTISNPDGYDFRIDSQGYLYFDAYRIRTGDITPAQQVNHIIDDSGFFHVETSNSVINLNDSEVNFVNANSQVSINASNVNISQGIGGENVHINVDTLDFHIYDGRTGTTATGIQYFADYSANYTARSVVDAGFVTGITSTLNPKSSFGITGDSVTTNFAITHNKNTRDIIVQVYENQSPYGTVVVDVERNTVNQITVKFGVAPTTGTNYRVVLI